MRQIQEQANTGNEKDELQLASNNNYDYKKNFKTALPQLLAVSVKNLLLLGYGMTLGFPTILIPAVKDPIEGEVLHLENSEISWISSINLIVVPIGCALSGVVTTPIGRRRAMQMVNLPFLLAWLLFHFSKTPLHLYGALFLTGLAGGLLEAPVLTYVAEITQPHLRGALSATSSMCIIIGVFTQFLFGKFFYWRTVALVNISFTVIAVVALCFVPESPHWLVSKQRHEEASKSLQWLRGWTDKKSVECELKDIQDLFKIKQVDSKDVVESFSEKISHFTNRSFLVPYFLICFCFFVGHFSGMTTLQSYAVYIFQILKAPIDKYYATLILGILQIVGSGLCVALVHYTGKRPLAIFSTAGAGLCCFLVAGYEIFIRKNGIQQEIVPLNSTSNSSLPVVENSIEFENPYSWIPTTLLMMLALITHTGIRLLPWILIGEVYSAKTRSSAAGLSGAAGYIFGFLTNKMYITMVDSLSIWGTYGLYGLVSWIGCLTLYFILPETEGKKLNEIQDHFAGVKRISNSVHRSIKRPNVESTKMEDIKGTGNPSYEDDNNTRL